MQQWPYAGPPLLVQAAALELAEPQVAELQLWEAMQQHWTGVEALLQHTHYAAAAAAAAAAVAAEVEATHRSSCSTVYTSHDAAVHVEHDSKRLHPDCNVGVPAVRNQTITVI